MRNSAHSNYERRAGTGYLLALLVVAFLSRVSFAETATFPRFSIEIASGWTHAIDEGERVANGFGQLITLTRPDGVGELKLQSYSVGVDVDQRTLRNLTNVESSIPLRWSEWGDFAGYQYSYTEQGSFYKQWWLANEATILFLVYQCDPSEQEAESQALVEMVASIRMVQH